MHRWLGRYVVCALIFVAFSLSGNSAETFPSRPIKIIVAFAPGGPVDTVARIVAAKLTAVMGQSVIVENRAGANGMIGTGYVAKSNPDGYTILLASPGSVVVDPAFYQHVPYDTTRDLIPVTQVTTTGEVFVVSSSLPVKSVRDLVGLAKTDKNLNFATGGIGSLAHLAILELNNAAGINLVHVPYTGMAPAITSLLGGQVQGAVGDLPVFLAQIESGKLRALGVAAPARSSLLPDLPTMAEQGLSAVEAINWYGVFVPVKTPPDVVNRIHDGLIRTLNDPGVRAKLKQIGTDPVGSSQAQFTDLVKRDLGRYAELAKETKLKID